MEVAEEHLARRRRSGMLNVSTVRVHRDLVLTRPVLRHRAADRCHVCHELSCAHRSSDEATNEHQEELEAWVCEGWERIERGERAKSGVSAVPGY